ncbi:MAG TPA: hypothetical protein VGR00_12360, partial [Thermoanaerobaculia bacterium]|nr:hypothetical protein [Thermoanaerobaculia bacterium]
YDTVTVSGMKGVTPVPATSLGFVFRDVNADGKADYVSFPWAMTAVLGVKQTGACLGPGPADPQVWLPLNDTNGDGYPDTVSVRMPDPSGSVPVAGLDGIPIVPASQGGITANGAADVPTLPVWGLLAFSVALAAGGVFLLRGRMPGIGA